MFYRIMENEVCIGILESDLPFSAAYEQISEKEYKNILESMPSDNDLNESNAVDENEEVGV